MTFQLDELLRSGTEVFYNTAITTGSLLLRVRTAPHINTLTMYRAELGCCLIKEVTDTIGDLPCV